MNTDLTFITNEKGQSLKERFEVLIRDTKFFDALVGYFYTSGFHALYKSLEGTEKIRILIGINTNRQTYELIRQARAAEQGTLPLSHAEMKEQFSDEVTSEMEQSEDQAIVEEGVQKFLEWLRSGKLEIRAYPSERIHAKLYIMTFAEGDRDVGRVITGSSNFTQAGLVDNLEFNVELKTRADYDFALRQFNALWANAVDVSEKYVETIATRTWLNDTITPYELYLKFLYEYFREKINLDQDSLYRRYRPEGFLDLEYQFEAVKDAKSKLEEYGGVFISDVVGLGKTYISAMLAQQLDGRTLVIAPPVLLDENNPGSWRNVFFDFGVLADYESVGKLDQVLKRGVEKYTNVIIDEAHRFRTESNITYEKLARICRGKRVILVTATPLNNTPQDILSQIKLFQKERNSTIPNIRDLKSFFGKLEARLKGLDRQKDYEEYLNVVRENAKHIREKVLKYLMVRRTRQEIVNYFGDDLQKQGLKFPDVADPEPVLYELNAHEDRVFNTTIELITQKFQYARYMPMLYYRGEQALVDKQGQRNMGRFMKILLVKRLESSFYAFQRTIERFVRSYEQFLEEYDHGRVYTSKKYGNKIFELLENDDEEAIQQLIDEEKAEVYETKDFGSELRQHLESDLALLREVQELWRSVERDPKLLTFLDILQSRDVLQKNKLVIFTESKETASYLAEHLQKKFGSGVLAFFGGASAVAREQVIENFDARARYPKNDFRLLVATEVLSEGVNLHRSNVVINYDIPWNPTRLMQRVGRVNRVDTKFKEIFTFNFFPTKQANTQIKLKEAAEAKIQAFIEMLGADARLLTEGEEVKSHDLFVRLTSKKTITGEDDQEESELKYLQVIRRIRDQESTLFERIKRLPKKARTATAQERERGALLSYFRKGKLQKFFLARAGVSEEVDFFRAATLIEATPRSARKKLGSEYYKLLQKNKEAFQSATTEETDEISPRSGRDSASIVLRLLRSKEIRTFPGYTDDDEEYLRRVVQLLEEGALPKQTARTLVQDLGEETNPLKILAKVRGTIPPEFFKETLASTAAQTAGPREVILSEYFVEG